MLKRAAMLLAASLAGTDLAPALAAAPYSQAFVIGDSMSDTGTFAPVTATGRFTTTPGRLWTEVVADSFGLSVAPAYFFDRTALRPSEGGTNFAQSGALVSGEAGLYDGVSKPVGWQVDRLIERASGRLDPNALYLVDGGGPDVILATLLVGQGKLKPEAAADRVQTAAREMVGHVRRLKDAGAEHVVLLNVADFGITPMLGAGQGPASALATDLSLGFNAALAEELKANGLDVVAPDLYPFFEALIADPAAHGLVNVTEPAVSDRAAPTPTGNAANSNPAHLVVADAASTYLFADGLHPSGRGHELLGRFVLATLSESSRH